MRTNCFTFATADAFCAVNIFEYFNIHRTSTFTTPTICALVSVEIHLIKAESIKNAV